MSKPKIIEGKTDDCPACRKCRLHTAEEWKKYHPHAGEGYSKT